MSTLKKHIWGLLSFNSFFSHHDLAFYLINKKSRYVYPDIDIEKEENPTISVGEYNEI